MSARDLAHILFRHQRKAGAVLAVALVLGLGAAALSPPAFRAEAGLIVEARPGGREEPALALAALLASRDLHRRVLEQIGAAALYPRLDAEAATAAFGRDLQVVPSADAAVVRLGYLGRDPELAAKALAILVDEARRRSAALYAAPADDARRAALTREAAATRERLEAWQRRNGVFDLGAERDRLLKRRAEQEVQAAAADSETEVLADRLKALQARLAATPPTIQLSTESERSKVTESAKAKLFELQTREQELLGRYLETSPLVQNLRAERRQVEQSLKGLDAPVEARVKSGANEVHQEMEKEVFRAEAALTAARARAKAATRQIAELDRKLATLSAGEKPLRELERAAAGAEAALAGLDPKGGTGPAGIGVLDSARAAPEPVGLRPLGVLGLAVLAGLLAAILVCFAAEHLSDSFSTPAAVERRLALPVLSSLPRES